MIRTSMQLKAKIRNISGGDNDKALVLIRNFVMERFLERIALSPYRDNFILKGGMLVSSIVGISARATMDIDTTVRAMQLSKENARKIIEEISSLDIQDGFSFSITKVMDIMEGHDYPGVRFMLDAAFDSLKQTIKIDISTGDLIIPEAVEYAYRLMFEDRSISIRTYNLETLLAEKLETVMSRENANTRMRDFYDIHILSKDDKINAEILRQAFIGVCGKRNSEEQLSRFDDILQSIAADPAMEKMWNKYRKENFFVGDLSWTEVNLSVKKLKNLCFSAVDTIHAKLEVDNG